MTTLQLRAPDGNVFPAYLAKPDGKPRGAIVVIQEIFGVNSHIRRVTEQYAEKGYVAIAPALFERQQKGVELGYDKNDMEKGIALMMKAGNEGVLADVRATMESVKHAGRVGMVGYCWGGRVTYLSACKLNLAAGVAYYGGGIAQLIADTPRCPFMFHFGEKDTHIPLTDVEAIRKAFPKGVYHMYPAGHGFNCTERADFDPPSARLAFDRTIEFFQKHVG